MKSGFTRAINFSVGNLTISPPTRTVSSPTYLPSKSNGKPISKVGTFPFGLLIGVSSSLSFGLKTGTSSDLLFFLSSTTMSSVLCSELDEVSD